MESAIKQTNRWTRAVYRVNIFFGSEDAGKKASLSEFYFQKMNKLVEGNKIENAKKFVPKIEKNALKIKNLTPGRECEANAIVADAYFQIIKEALKTNHIEAAKTIVLKIKQYAPEREHEAKVMVADAYFQKMKECLKIKEDLVKNNDIAGAKAIVLKIIQYAPEREHKTKLIVAEAIFDNGVKYLDASIGTVLKNRSESYDMSLELGGLSHALEIFQDAANYLEGNEMIRTRIITHLIEKVDILDKRALEDNQVKEMIDRGRGYRPKVVELNDTSVYWRLNYAEKILGELQKYGYDATELRTNLGKRAYECAIYLLDVKKEYPHSEGTWADFFYQLGAGRYLPELEMKVTELAYDNSDDF